MFHDRVAHESSVLSPDTLAELSRRLTTRPILPQGAGTRVTIGRAALERLLPHRGPMLLVDAIDEVDRSSRSIRGHRHFVDEDPGFAGHFPEAPVYPAVLIVEAIGQLSLALLHFADHWHFEVPDEVIPSLVQVVRIHVAAFLTPFVPGDTMELHAHVIERDATVLAAGQAWKNGTLAAFAISELRVDDMRNRRRREEPAATHRDYVDRPARRRRAPFGHPPLEEFLD
jgi:3-hydroxyacyl-[acyl-carrier-protein] dehydratase